jgi:hypothetical protein
MNPSLEREEAEEVTLLTVADLMQRTKESESCWRKRLGRGELPVVKCGANTRVRLEDFQNWIKERMK